MGKRKKIDTMGEVETKVKKNISKRNQGGGETG